MYKRVEMKNRVVILFLLFIIIAMLFYNSPIKEGMSQDNFSITLVNDTESKTDPNPVGVFSVGTNIDSPVDINMNKIANINSNKNSMKKTITVFPKNTPASAKKDNHYADVFPSKYHIDIEFKNTVYDISGGANILNSQNKELSLSANGSIYDGNYNTIGTVSSDLDSPYKKSIWVYNSNGIKRINANFLISQE